jgi:lipopolysaccharide biosynthesis regulator YciM
MYACHVYLQMEVLVTNTKQMNRRLTYHVGYRATARQQQLHVMHMQADLVSEIASRNARQTYQLRCRGRELEQRVFELKCPSCTNIKGLLFSSQTRLRCRAEPCMV